MLPSGHRESRGEPRDWLPFIGWLSGLVVDLVILAAIGAAIGVWLIGFDVALAIIFGPSGG